MAKRTKKRRKPLWKMIPLVWRRRIQRAAVGGTTVACLVLVIGVAVRTKRDVDAKASYRRLRPMIVATAERHEVDPHLVLAVIRKESNFNPDAVGKAGEIGLMQLMDGAVKDWERVTRKRLGRKSNLYKPEVNVEIGVWYLAQAVRQFKGHRYQDELALSQYNAGRSRALKWARDYRENLPERIPIASTRSYISMVSKYRSNYEAEARR